MILILMLKKVILIQWLMIIFKYGCNAFSRKSFINPNYHISTAQPRRNFMFQNLVILFSPNPSHASLLDLTYFFLLKKFPKRPVFSKDLFVLFFVILNRNLPSLIPLLRISSQARDRQPVESEESKITICKISKFLLSLNFFFLPTINSS